MAKKWLKNIMALSMAAGMVFSAACGGGNSGDSSSSAVEPQPELEASLRIAYAEDKILQSYEGTSSLEAFGERFSGYLMNDFSIAAFRNEHESRHVVITPNIDVAAYDLSVSDFKCGNNVLPASAFDLRHEYYHEVSTIMSSDSTMQPGMYPDAMVPLSAAKEYKLNKIAANENQAVLVTVKVPADQPTGVYTGTITVTLDGKEEKMSATVEVLDYTLPEQVQVKSAVQLTTGNLAALEADVTQERYDKIVSSLNDFRLSVQWLYGMRTDTTRDDVVQATADEQILYMLKAANDPKVSAYGFSTNGKADPVYGGSLNTDWFMIFLRTYVEASLENQVDLFEKAYTYMGSIIDEPEQSEELMNKVDYVCQQYNDCLEEAATYAAELAALDTYEGTQEFAQSLIASILDVEHVVTTRIDSPGGYDLVDTYCTEPQYYDSSAKVDDYRQHRENGGDYWLYTCCNPKTPYPTIHIDDNGVSARVMYWMMRDYDISGYLIWEVNGTGDGFPDYSNPKTLYGIEQYEDVMRNNTDVGDGYYYYPGKVFGLDNSVPALRLFYLRDGTEDYDAITDLENNLYPALSQKYGATLNASGVLDEMYSYMYNLNQVHCTSADVAKAKTALNTLMVWANNGVAISDYKILSNGNVSTKLYAPQGVEVKANGKVLTGSESGEGVVYTIDEKAATLSVEACGQTLELGCETTNIFTIDATKVSFQNAKQETVENVSVAVNKYEGVDTLKVEATEDVYAMFYELEKDQITTETETLLVYVYLDAPEKVKMSLNVRGKARRIVDAVYVNPGYNVLRFDRLCDLEWNKIKEATQLVFTFDKPETVTTFTLNVEAINVVK